MGSSLIKDDLEKEIQKYLKTNQDVHNPEELEPELRNELNSKNEERQNELNKIIEGRSLDDLLKICLSTISETSKDELKMIRTNKSTDEYSKKNKDISENTNLLIRKYEEFDKYNKNLLVKIKDLTEEKKKTENDENEKKREIEKKCDDFKNDV